MKKQFTIIATALALLCACSNEDSDTAAKSITFHIDNITEEYSTRASISSVGMTDLWVWEGQTLLAHKVSTDSDFDAPIINLTYGSHDLTFVSSKADSQSWANGVWSTTKEWDTYATTMNVNVSGNSGNSRQVQLARRSSKVKFQTTDNVPSDVKTMHLTVGNHKSLDKDLKGGTAYVHEATIDITGKVGSTYSVFVNTLTESATDEEDCNVMIEFLNAQNSTLYKFERTIKMKANRCTTLKGEYFTGGDNAITVDTTWLDELEVPLFE